MPPTKNDYERLMGAVVRYDAAVKEFVKEAASLHVPLHDIIEYLPQNYVNRLQLAQMVAFERNKKDIPKETPRP